MIYFTVIYVFVLYCSSSSAAGDVTVEPIETTWRLANAVCETSKHILMPGRSYKKADLIKTLDVGQKIWMKGWRMVTEREPDKKGTIRFLKVDFIPNYNVLIRKFVCEYANGTYEVPSEAPSGQANADAACKRRKGKLATIGRHDVTSVMDTIGDKIPHWSQLVTSDDSIAKQCLAARRTTTSIKYYYEDCSTNLPFVCLRDERSSMVFAPVISKRYSAFEDFADEIIRIAARVTPTPSLEKQNDLQSSMNVTHITTTDSIVTSYSSFVKESMDISRLLSIPISSKTSSDISLTSERTNLSSSRYSIVASTSSDILPESTTFINKPSVTSIQGTVSQLPDVSNFRSVELSPKDDIKFITTDLLYSSPWNVSRTGSAISSIMPSVTLTSVSEVFPANLITPVLFTSVYQQANDSESPSQPISSIDERMLHSSMRIYEETHTHIALETSLSGPYLHKSGTDGVDTAVSPTLSENERTNSTTENAFKSVFKTTNDIQMQSTIKNDRDLESEFSLNQHVGSSFVFDFSTNTQDTTWITTPADEILSSILYRATRSSQNEIHPSFNVPLNTKTVSIYSDRSTGSGITNSGISPFSDTYIYLPDKYNGTVSFTTNLSNTTVSTISKSEKVATFITYVNSADFTSVINATIHMPIASDTRTLTSVQNSTNSSSTFTTEWNNTMNVTKTQNINQTNTLSTENMYTRFISMPTTAISSIGIISNSMTSQLNKVNITPTPAKDIYMSHDLGKIDLEEVGNRSSKESPQEDMSLSMWIAVGVIAVACLISIAIAIVLYKRKKKEQKTCTLSNGAEHPLRGRETRWSQNEAYAAPVTKNKKSRNKSEHKENENVFIDEAYDL